MVALAPSLIRVIAGTCELDLEVLQLLDHGRRLSQATRALQSRILEDDCQVRDQIALRYGEATEPAVYLFDAEEDGEFDVAGLDFDQDGIIDRYQQLTP